VFIRGILPEVNQVATYQLEFADSADAAAYEFLPGQFNMLYLPGAGEIPISLSENPRATTSWAHTIRVAGRVTRILANRHVGDSIGLRGPFGRGWPVEEGYGKDVILVAGGIGLAPLRPLIYAMLNERDRFGRINVLHGARTPDTILYTREYQQWDDQELLVKTTSDRPAVGWSGNVGVVTMLLQRLTTFEPDNTVLFCCGPEVMMKYTALTAINRGIAPTQVWISTERNMQCAVGHCGHCQLGPQFICKDGPVFRYDHIVELMGVRDF
jgi:NAD(P)H-flavin reductase